MPLNVQGWGAGERALKTTIKTGEKIMEEKEKDQSNDSLKNLLIIIGTMAVIYFATFILWNLYVENLENHYYYPYVKIKETGYERVKKMPFSPKGYNITIEKSNITNTYTVKTKFGSFNIQTFDDRFFFFENSDMVVISYPSYDFRGLEYSVILKNGNIFKFVIVPNEEIVEDIFTFVENLLRIRVLEVPELANYDYIKESEDSYTIESKRQEFTLSKNLISTVGESQDYIYFISKKYGLFNKIYYLEKSTNNFGELIMISESQEFWSNN
ncbi:hypothetical protein X928_01860 [Petrotoga miotherma DSM 10691]|uniref:Uncharacterized protein n=3 Tax=Petrotogaceae TaxID=1643949 RepID=A0A2K1PGB8_9BACT|nr:hypothetical protein X928_01860 [Petrotoga miotherma DSM 10691]POZ90260.1 hypothetical protein AA81_11705 [Petrotoga halophila DSM 16923]